MADTTWGVELDSLDEYRAGFRFQAHDISFGMSRTSWENMGKPSKLWITPKKELPRD